MFPFDYRAVVVIGKVSTLVFNDTSRVPAATPADRLMSVRNRCVIEVLVASLCCHVAFWIFLWE